MTIDVDRARAETPGCAHVLHFNNAGAGLTPAPVIDAVRRHLDLEARIGGYEAADAAAAQHDHTYDALARFLNCDRDEVAVVENATVGWDMAFYAIAETLNAGDRVLTAEAEYASNYIAYLQTQRRIGFEIVTVPSTETGEMDVAALENLIDDRVKLISITHVPTNGGLVNPAAEVGRLARAAGIPFILDACQSAGQVPLDVRAIGCDVLTATGRKYLRGPRGTGFVYVRRALAETLEPPFLDLHAAKWSGPDSYDIAAGARRFENWEFNVANKIGLGVAVDYASDWGQQAINDRVVMLAERLRRDLTSLPGVDVLDLGRERCGIVSFRPGKLAPRDLMTTLRERAINCHTSAAPSTLMDMSRRGLDIINRASVHYYNTEEEIERFCAALEELV